GRRAENGSITKGRSVGRTACRLPVRLETAVRVHAAGRLGICIATHERPSALLAEHVVALLRQTGCKAGEGGQERELSHVSPHLRDTAECQWGKSQGGSGALAARQPEGHDRRLHASSQLPKEGSTKQVGKDGQGSWHEVNAASATGPNWTMKNFRRVQQVFYLVGVPGGIWTRVTAVKGRCPRPG